MLVEQTKQAISIFLKYIEIGIQLFYRLCLTYFKS